MSAPPSPLRNLTDELAAFASARWLALAAFYAKGYDVEGTGNGYVFIPASDRGLDALSREIDAARPGFPDGLVFVPAEPSDLSLDGLPDVETAGAYLDAIDAARPVLASWEETVRAGPHSAVPVLWEFEPGRAVWAYPFADPSPDEALDAWENGGDPPVCSLRP